MSHTAANPRFEDNGEGRCFHCGAPETAHPQAAQATAPLTAVEAHAEAEQWLWEAEQMETGPFWRSFSLDLFRAMLRRIPLDRARVAEAAEKRCL